MKDYTADSIVNIKLSIADLVNLHKVSYASFELEPHDPAKSSAFYTIQSLLEEMMQDKELKTIINDLYTESNELLVN